MTKKRNTPLEKNLRGVFLFGCFIEGEQVFQESNQDREFWRLLLYH